MRHFLFFLLVVLFVPVSVFAQDLDIYEKAEQMIILGFRGNTLETSDVSSVLSTGNWGGVILFDYDTPTKTYGRNISSHIDLKKFITSIQSRARTPLFISLDEEGGKVSRLKSFPLFKSTYSALDVGRFSNTTIKDISLWRAKQINQFGFNMNFAPVIDICYTNTVMVAQKRCFHANDTKVINSANIMARAFETYKIIPVYKHYPGIGTGTKDTHNGFVDITKTHTKKDEEIFSRACASAVYPVVMVSHIVDTDVDTVPASLSKNHIANLRKAHCKDALVVSDDMDMKAITDTYTLSDVLEKSISSGVDMIIFSNNMGTYQTTKPQQIKQTLKTLIDSGKILPEQIESSYAKIIRYKKAFGICKAGGEIDFCS